MPKPGGMKQAQTVMLKAMKQDHAERFADIPDSGLQLDLAGTFENEESAKKWLQMAQKDFRDWRFPISICRAVLPAMLERMRPGLRL